MSIRSHLALLTLIAGCSPPAAPASFDWRGASCAGCGMEVLAPSFAVHCATASGESLLFDDLGCLLIERGMGRLEPGTVHLRHLREERWIAAEDAALVRHAATPMGFGYAAVDADEGQLTIEAALAEMTERFELGVR